MPTVAEIVGSIDALMGVKAVFGKLRVPLLCFGSRGDAAMKDRKHYMQGRSVAERSLSQPYIFAIGGGPRVRDGLKGKVVNLARCTGAYGDTSTFVDDPERLAELTDWPVAVAMSEVFSVDGDPHLVDDLGLSDRMILANAFDGVTRRDGYIDDFWSALKNCNVTRAELPPIHGFRDPGKVVLVGQLRPSISPTSEEGKRVWKEMLVIERSSKAARGAKSVNAERNGGVLVCDACGFSDDKPAMFDAHHLLPISAGRRESKVEDFAVLCPTCHRWCHHKCTNALQPLTVDQVRTMRLR